jgi:hypothetical protein
MNDIFNSQVNSSVQAELNARGKSGETRTTADLNFMLAKTAGVEIVPYAKTPSGSFQPIAEGILNGLTIRDGEFLPGGERGYLTDRAWKRVGGETPGSGVNSSKRLPPYVTSVDIQLADHSIGLLNTCTFNILVQNPEQDLEYIETLYCRPGRPVDVTIAYPESAVLSENAFLADEPMDSEKRLAALKQENAAATENADAPKQKQKLNETRFQGLIINFSIEYQTDLTCVINVVVRGTSNVFTDVTALIESGKQTVNSDTPENVDITIDRTIEQDKTIFAELKRQYDVAAAGLKKTKGYIDVTKPSDDYPRGEAEVIPWTINGRTHYGMRGRLFSRDSEPEQYISLGWFIAAINDKVLSKININKNTIESAKIILDPTITAAFVNNKVVSVNPKEIFLPSDEKTLTKQELDDRLQELQTPENVNGTLTVDVGWKYIGFNDYITDAILPQDKITCYSQVIITGTGEPSPVADGVENIMINLSVLKNQYDILQGKSKKNISINTYIKSILDRIRYATGESVNLNLISHPSDPNILLLYNIDRKSATQNQFDAEYIEPYSVPMFANHPHGSIVTEFKFSGQLPKDSANLAFAINDLDTDTSDESISPFLNYMYSVNNITRRNENNVLIETYDNPVSIDEYKGKWISLRLKAIKRYVAAAKKYAQAQTLENQTELHSALIESLKYTGERFEDEYLVKQAVLPFTVSFTTDGINGLKYGDILTFDGLPSRYKRNLVYGIISISHTLSETGEWKTKVDCVSRVKIDGSL